MAGPSPRLPATLAAAALGLALAFCAAHHDVIPDEQLRLGASDVLVMVLSIAASLMMLSASRRAAFAAGHACAASDESAMTVHAPSAMPRAARAEPKAGSRENGAATLFGRLYLDICQLRGAGWAFYRARETAGCARHFIAPSIAAGYAVAADGGLQSIEACAAAALRDAAIAGAAPSILKLYVGRPNGFPQPGGKRVVKIGGKLHAILPARTAIRDRIPLGDSYENFVSGLGRHSRRNLRHAQARALRLGITHSVESVPRHFPAELRTLAGNTYPTGARPGIVAAIHRLLGAHGRGFHSILSLPSGEILSCCSGFIEGDTAFVLHQMNHGAHLDLEPSLTNRAFLIAHLIQTGVRDLVFIKGCRGILHHACVPESGEIAWVVRLSPASLLCAPMLLAQVPLIDAPARLRAVVTHMLRGSTPAEAA
jgi:hypothetical protein